MDHLVNESTSYITVKLFAGLRDLFGQKEYQFDARRVSDIRGLVEALCTTSAQRQSLLKDSEVLREGLLVLVNGHNIALRGNLDANVQGGDEIAIFPPMYGG